MNWIEFIEAFQSFGDVNQPMLHCCKDIIFLFRFLLLLLILSLKSMGLQGDGPGGAENVYLSQSPS